MRPLWGADIGLGRSGGHRGAPGLRAASRGAGDRFLFSHGNRWGFFIIVGEGMWIAAAPGGSDMGAKHPPAHSAAEARFVKTWVGFSLWLSSCMSVCDIIKLENRM